MYFNKDENSNWTIDSELLSQYYPEAFEILNGIKNFTGNDGISIKNYEFITFHQSFSYEDFIEGIKPKLNDGETDLNFEIKDGIFKKLCIKAELDSDNNYAIFIDEINRGNVSAIFGELITLIEADKRIGATNELKVKLPYSKKEFGVPPNLFIIGTMNTADRSVEALDTALRRRFSFVEMMPDVKVIEEKKFTDYDRVKIMNLINQRIEVLLDRNYTLGHSYFIKEDFINSFKNEIIPLLQEYFYNDYGKIGLVLGKGFVREKAITIKNDKSIFADFDTKNEVDITKSYELIPFTEIDFKEAINTLLA
jgi:5-methylcytosine-specific restriction endonuclease McrBC GTP-binding regulatory subunit McrB